MSRIGQANAYAACTECLFMPVAHGAWPPTIVSYINPLTGRTMVWGDSVEEVIEREPGVIRITIADARARMAAWNAQGSILGADQQEVSTKPNDP